MRGMLALLALLLSWAGAEVRTFDCPLPDTRTAWLGTNGPDTVVWLVLEADVGAGHAALDARARTVVLGAYRCQPDLLDVDVTLVPRGTPTRSDDLFAAEPLMTLSVPGARLSAFRRLAPGHWNGSYDRVWYADTAPPLPEVGPAPVGEDHWPLWSRWTAATLGGLRGGVMERGQPWSRRVALTVDDGPHPLFTPLLLATLRREGLGATCFLIGRNARAYPYFVRDLRAQGIEIGNHGYAHLRPQALHPEAQWRDLMLGQRVLTRLAGTSPRFFRPPGGGVTPALLAQTRAAGLTLALWTDDPADYALTRQDRMLSRLWRHLTRGGTLLLHDNAPMAIGALPALAREARRRGLTVGPLSDLLR